MRAQQLVAVLTALALFSNCGAGPSEEDAGSASTPDSSVPDASLDDEALLDIALMTGNATELGLDTIARRLGRASRALREAQETRLASLWTGVDSAYDPTRWSNYVRPMNWEVAQPFIVGDDGHVLASFSIANGGRSAGYGVNVLGQFADSENEAHRPAFVRLVKWLLTGDANAPLPTPLTVTFAGLSSANEAAAGLQAAGVTFTRSACNNVACASDSQLLVVGDQLAVSDTLEASIRAHLTAGLPVLYVHDINSGWPDSPSGRQLLAAMSLELVPEPGNYFAQDKVAAGRSAEALLETARGFDVLAQQVATDAWRTDFDWSRCTSSVGATSCSDVPGLTTWTGDVDALRAAIDGFSASARDVFATPDTTVLRLWSLWADVQRRGRHYPLDKVTQPARFQAAFIADAVVPYVRQFAPAQSDLGTYAGPAQLAMKPSTTDEAVRVTLPAGSGFTIVGRMAVPGVTLQATLVDAAGASVALALNTQRTGSTRAWDTDGFNRPRFLTSPKIPLSEGRTLAIVGPYGGTLQLHYADATPGSVVTLRLRAVAQHPYLDETAVGDLAAARVAFIAALNAGGADWAELKLNGVEVHTRVDKLREVVTDEYANDTERYLREINALFFEDAYLLAGFALPNQPLPARVLAQCQTLGWDCTNATWHRPPGVQHINVDVSAHCGAGCSGNPYDQSWGLAPRGWGESHELGHNLQTFRVYDDRSSEVSNQLFPLHKNWRLFREFADDREADRVDYRAAFDAIVAGKAAANPIDGVYQRAWADPEYAAQNGLRMAFFTQWVHYWAQRENDPARGWDIWTLAYLHERIVAKATWADVKVSVGYSTYATRPELDDNDALLIALSWVTQRDQRATFALWGITTTMGAQAQVSAWGLAAEPAFFFANDQTNDHSSAVRVDMTVAVPVWPL